MSERRRITTSLPDLVGAPRRGKVAGGLSLLAVAIVVLAVMFLMQRAPSSGALGASLIAFAAVIVPFALSRMPHESGDVDGVVTDDALVLPAGRSSAAWGLALAITGAVAAWFLFVGATDPQLNTSRYVLAGVVVLAAAAVGGLYQVVLVTRAVSIELGSHEVRARRRNVLIASVPWSTIAAASASKMHLTLFLAPDGSAVGPLSWDVRLLKSDPQVVAKLIEEAAETGSFEPDRLAR